MKKYILITILTLAAVAATLTSCGGNDAATNNGSDTGVNGTHARVTDGTGRNMTDGTMFDDNMNNNGTYAGDVENDVYNNDGFASDSVPGNVETAGDMMNGADMSYDSNGTTNSTTMNY